MLTQSVRLLAEAVRRSSRVGQGRASGNSACGLFACTTRSQPSEFLTRWSVGPTLMKPGFSWSSDHLQLPNQASGFEPRAGPRTGHFV